MVIRFGTHELDRDNFELRREGEVVPLQPKVFDVLSYLLEHRGRVVSKRELLDELWAGEHVNESAVPWSISHARRAIGQQRGDKEPIETVHGRGYRFVGEVLDTASRPPPPPSPAPGSVPPPPSSAPRTAGPPPEDSTPLVGRRVVMERLQERLAQLRQGRGQLVLLAGEAGIGKTRCATELARVAFEQGVTVWTGRCVDVVGAPVFWPFIQVLRAIARERPELAERAQELLARMVADDEGDAGGAADDADGQTAGRFWLLDSANHLLQDAARTAPVMVVLDDLHWADAASLELLAFQGPDLARNPLLVVGTLRDELDEETEPRLRRIGRHAERIPLSRLDVGDVSEYMTALIGAEPDAALANAVQRATAGNPLFLRETMRGLIAAHGEEGTRKLSPSDVRPPEVARDVLRARMANLPEAERRLLSMASVLGEEFELSVLQALADAESQELLSTLEGPVRAGLLQAPSPHRYRFAHELMRSLLYADLPTAELAKLHRRAAEALVAISAGEPRSSEIAFHYYRSLAAGDYAKVASHARRAANAAMRAYAYADAITYYEWALEAQALDASATARDRAELLMKCGEAQRRAGRDVEARATLSRTIETARQHGFADLLLRAARGLRPTQAMSAVPDPLVRGAMEEVLRLVPDHASAERVAALSMLACLPPYSHDMERSKELSGRALSLARELDDRGSLLEAMRARLYSLSGVDDLEELLSLCDEMIEAEGGRPTSWITGEARAAQYGAFVLRGDMVRADRALAELRAVTDALKWPEVTWYHDRLAAQRLIMTGDFEAAEAEFKKLGQRSRRMRLGYGEGFTRINQGAIALERAGARALAAYIDVNVEPGQSETLWASVHAHRIRLAAELGGREDVVLRALEDQRARDFARVPRDISYLNTLAGLAEAAARVDDQATARRLYELLQPYAGYNTPNGMLNCVGAVDHYLALLAACLGDDDAVEPHFRAALELEQRMGARPRVARTRVALARWLSQRDDAEERARGRAEAEQAASEARALGMGWLERRAQRLLEPGASAE